jgi:hypothetical protein
MILWMILAFFVGVIPSYGGITLYHVMFNNKLHPSSCLVQETGRKHLQAMQRKTVTAPDRSGWVVFEKFQLNSNML